MIGRDLYGKKDQQTSKQETFEFTTEEQRGIKVTKSERKVTDSGFSSDQEKETGVERNHNEITESQRKKRTKILMPNANPRHHHFVQRDGRNQTWTFKEFENS